MAGNKYKTAMRLPSQEGSGLKHRKNEAEVMRRLSSLARGKWIEACIAGNSVLLIQVFPRKMEVD